MNKITDIRLLLLFMVIALANIVTFSYPHREQKPQHIEKKAMEVSSKKPSFLLNFLYKNTLGKVIRSGLTKKWVSSAAGVYCNHSISKVHIKSFIETHSILISEAEKPLNQFKTFNDFFIRTLKPEARPIDSNPLNIIAPADGQIIALEKSKKNMLFPIKQTNFNLEKFLNNKELAESYDGGTIMIFRLAPWDYHRFHFPCACIPSKARIINGRYESVNPLVYLTGVQPLTENERHVSILKTSLCDDIIMVSVGALCVGKIIETYQPTQHYQKGTEAGYFCFGGSTLVLVFKQDTITVNPEIVKNSLEGKETPIKMGMHIATVIAKQ